MDPETAAEFKHQVGRDDDKERSKGPTGMSDTSERHLPEKRQRELLEELMAELPFPPFEQFRAFPVLTPRLTLARFLAHYEVFKRIVELPGAIVDLGVYRGASTFTWAKLCEIFCPTDIRKTVFAFDTFAGFTDLHTHDGAENLKQDRRPGGYAAGANMRALLDKAQAAMNEDRQLRHIDRIQFIEGDVEETIPRFCDERGQGLKVALMNLDLDLYRATKVALEHFVPRMVAGGIIIVDEYAVETFGGESRAVDEYFLSSTGRLPRVQKFHWHSNPSAFIVI